MKTNMKAKTIAFFIGVIGLSAAAHAGHPVGHRPCRGLCYPAVEYVNTPECQKLQEEKKKSDEDYTTCSRETDKKLGQYVEFPSQCRDLYNHHIRALNEYSWRCETLKDQSSNSSSGNTSSPDRQSAVATKRTHDCSALDTPRCTELRENVHTANTASHNCWNEKNGASTDDRYNRCQSKLDDWYTAHDQWNKAADCRCYWRPN